MIIVFHQVVVLVYIVYSYKYLDPLKLEPSLVYIVYTLLYLIYTSFTYYFFTYSLSYNTKV